MKTDLSYTMTSDHIKGRGMPLGLIIPKHNIRLLITDLLGMGKSDELLQTGLIKPYA